MHGTLYKERKLPESGSKQLLPQNIKPCISSSSGREEAECSPVLCDTGWVKGNSLQGGTEAFVFLWTHGLSVNFCQSTSCWSRQLFLQTRLIFQLYETLHLRWGLSVWRYSLWCTAGSVLCCSVLFCPSFFSPLCSRSPAELCAAPDKSLSSYWCFLEHLKWTCSLLPFLERVQWQTALLDYTNISKYSPAWEDWKVRWIEGGCFICCFFEET